MEAIYTLQNGLTNGHVGCMVDDRIGNTWAGNNVGVMTIRNGQDAFYNYLSVGNCSAVCRLNDGRLLWANSWGLIFFDPSATKADCERSEWRNDLGWGETEWTGDSFRFSGTTEKACIQF